LERLHQIRYIYRRLIEGHHGSLDKLGERFHVFGGIVFDLRRDLWIREEHGGLLTGLQVLS
jgi:hypothetical protein